MLKITTPYASTLVLAASLAVASFSANADMKLDSAASSLSLVSTKVLAPGNASVSERFTFSGLNGMVDAAGNATIQIPLGSVITGIDIRNERMAKYLFEVDKFPAATITAMIPAELMSGEAQLAEITAALSLRGKTSVLNIPVLISSADGKVMVSATEPVLVDAKAHDLDAGLGKLAESVVPTTSHVLNTVHSIFRWVFDLFLYAINAGVLCD